MKTTYKKLFALAIVMLIALGGQLAMAQSTIFNIPTTDTVAKGKGYFEFDYFGQMPKPDGVKMTNIFVPRAIVGLGPNLEAGANFGFYHAGSTQSFFEPDIKWRFVNMDDKGLAASVGVVAYTPMNNRDFVDSAGLFYGNISKKVKSGNYGPRFTAGPYVIATKENSATFLGSGPRAGAIVGYEQPIASKASIVADWYSGKNFFGYFTPGLSFTLPGNGLFNIGYSIGNDSWANSNATKNRYLFIYYGVTF